MESLKIYRIQEKYIRFLQSRDSRVLYNKRSSRPYVGVVLHVGSYQYFVPMESPKPNHVNISSGKHIFKIDGGRLGLLGFNNMVPVPSVALIHFDISQEPDAQYAELLRRQIAEINRIKQPPAKAGGVNRRLKVALRLKPVFLKTESQFRLKPALPLTETQLKVY